MATKPMKVLVTGGKGLLGTELAKHLDFIGIDIQDADITDFEAISAVIKQHNPDLVVHLAALVNAVQCELDHELAYEVNVNGTKNVALSSKHIIYITSDYIFDGEKGNYKETDKPNPINYYGLTKYCGEFMAQLAPKWNIIRTSFKPRPYKHQLVPPDMIVTSDYIDVIAQDIALAIKNVDKLPPIVNIGREKKFLIDLARQTRNDIMPVSRDALPIRIPRDTSLDTTLWKSLNLI